MSWQWVWWALAGLFVLNGLRLRGLARGLARLPSSAGADNRADDDSASDNRADESITAGTAAPERWEWRTARGCDPDNAVRATVERYATTEGLSVLDVVPRDLPIERAFDLLRAVKPKLYRQDPLATGVSARQATVAVAEVAERSKLHGAADLDPVAMRESGRVWKEFAPHRADVVVSAALAAGPEEWDKRQGLLRAQLGSIWWVNVAVPVALLGVTIWGVVVAPLAGGVALAAWSLQPVVALAGTTLRPRDLWWRSVLRAPATVFDTARTVAGRWRPAPAADRVDPESLRPLYDQLLAEGTAHFFEARRTECPMCDSKDLSVRLRTKDMLQGKPGHFTLERCGACGHIFQNPRLSPGGLDFYYRDFYDGLGQGEVDLAFGFGKAAYATRAGALRGRATPTRWLDVGTGHGHFCVAATADWPGVTFDGIDMSESIEEAERRGWVTRGYRGVFPQIAPQIAGTYDVVSMFHYLEHTREPRDEIAAAAVALAPGGHLVVEVPNAQSGLAPMLGRYWLPWFQPQHQHFLSLPRLSEELAAQNFEVVDTVVGFGGRSNATVVATFLLLNHVAPLRDLPWRKRPRVLARLGRWAALVVSIPLFVLARLVDVALSIVTTRRWRAGAFLVVARRGPG